LCDTFHLSIQIVGAKTDLSVRRQCALLNQARSGFYRPKSAAVWRAGLDKIGAGAMSYAFRMIHSERV
jgi:hypothetical protein